MPPDFSLPVYFLVSILAGLVGAVALSLVVRGISKAHDVTTDLTSMMGRFFVKDHQKAARLALILHGVFGILFAFFYVWLMTRAQFYGQAFNLFIGAGIGFLHGIVAAIMLMFLVNENHPDPRWRNATMSVGFAYLFGHIAYGFTVGLVVAISPLG
jgi:uncharacterized membrane protein YagU involved in acid resistance